MIFKESNRHILLFSLMYGLYEKNGNEYEFVPSEKLSLVYRKDELYLITENKEYHMRDYGNMWNTLKG